MNRIYTQFTPDVLSGRKAQARQTTSVAATQEAGQTPFQQILAERISAQQEVRFSAHASERLRDRNISMSAQDIGRLENAVKQAETKGAKNTLVLADNYALIVNVPNRTVITAMSRGQMADHIVTNIDSTVLLD
ncbi:MAG TPA: TIGR02530 family flagellar biosynthesis protein [bacterium]|nr:TIGR02530 family flagellar biosynthesis protein [bacterium]